MAEFPPLGSDFEEEEEQHEEEAGADVEKKTETHVHAGEAHAQNPDPAPFLMLLPLPPYSSCCWTLLPGLTGLNRTGSRREEWGGQGVPGGQVGRSVVMAEEGQDVVVVPNMDAMFLLMAGGAEGGAWPRSFGEERIVAQRP